MIVDEIVNVSRLSYQHMNRPLDKPPTTLEKIDSFLRLNRVNEPVRKHFLNNDKSIENTRSKIIVTRNALFIIYTL